MTPTRREVITAFLGAAAAQLACRRKPAEPVPGAIVDRGFALGHRLRAGPLPRAKEERKVEALIVGAGAAGLSAAWRLASAGLGDFFLCEVDDEAGGTSRSGKNAITAFPWGAHYLPAPLDATGPIPRLLTELGAITGVDDRGRPHFAEQMLVREPEVRTFYKGTWYEGLYLRAGASPSDLAELQRFEALVDDFARRVDAKGRKAFTVPAACSSDDAEFTALDSLSMRAWLDQQGLTSNRLRWLVDYACRDDFGTDAAHTSAWAGIWYFASRQDGRGGRSAGFLSWPEGNGRLIRHLLSSVPRDRLLRSTLVHSIEPGREDCLVHAFDGASGAPLAFRARQVILAVPQFVAARVLAPYREAPPAGLSEFHYGPWVVANLTLSAAPGSRTFPLAWDNVLYESQSLGYVMAQHQAEVSDETGARVLSWYFPLVGEDVKAERARLLTAEYGDWEAIVMTDLLAAHPEIRRLSQRLEVWRWGHGMVRPRPGFVWSNARRNAQQSFGSNVHFAHSDLSGLAVFEEANWFGVRAAEKVLSELQRRPTSWL
jgi:protoporphyrinogen oxidase